MATKIHFGVIFRTLLAGTFLFLASNAFATSHQRQEKLTPAARCQTLNCVRNNIDLVDMKIVNLMGARLTYVKRAGELKKHQKSLHDQSRENEILKKVGQQAEKAGYPASIGIAVFKTILLQSNLYEKQFHRYRSQ